MTSRLLKRRVRPDFARPATPPRTRRRAVGTRRNIDSGRIPLRCQPGTAWHSGTSASVHAKHVRWSGSMPKPDSCPPSIPGAASNSALRRPRRWSVRTRTWGTAGRPEVRRTPLPGLCICRSGRCIAQPNSSGDRTMQLTGWRARNAANLGKPTCPPSQVQRLGPCRPAPR